MGETIVSVTIRGPAGSRTFDGLVDTGATFTKISRSLGDALGLEPFDEVAIQLADGRLETRPVALVNLEVEGVTGPVVVTLADNVDRPLIGMTTLENLRFKVNPIEERLEPTPAIEY